MTSLYLLISQYQLCVSQRHEVIVFLPVLATLQQALKHKQTKDKLHFLNLGKYFQTWLSQDYM